MSLPNAKTPCERITITVKAKRGTDTRRALQAALKYMGRLGLACVAIRDGQPQPPATPPKRNPKDE